MKKSQIKKDITPILENWPENASEVTARLITGKDGQAQLQMRLDCGILQMNLDDRPDGIRLHGCFSCLEYLQRILTRAGPAGLERRVRENRIGEKLWDQLARELSQFYHRRLALLAIAKQFKQAGRYRQAKQFYRKAIRDANHTLKAMDFISQHCRQEDYIDAHERFKPFVLWHRALALTQTQLLDGDFDEAVEQVKYGMNAISQVYEDHGLRKWLRYDPSVAELRALERKIRKKYDVKVTLKEQLEKAVGSEDYELAAQIRDKLRARGQFNLPLAQRIIPAES